MNIINEAFGTVEREILFEKQKRSAKNIRHIITIQLREIKSFDGT